MQLISAPWILPVTSPQGGVLTEHCIAMQGGRIVDVLPLGQAHRQHPEAECEHLERCALLPALVNAHTHAAMTLLRGVAEDLPLDAWLNERIWPIESACLSREYVADGTRLAIAEMLLGGTGCFADMYFHPDVILEVAADCGARAQVGIPVLDIPGAWSCSDAFEQAEEVRSLCTRAPLLSAALAPHAVYSLSLDDLRRTGEQARALDLRVHIHLAETRQEVDGCLSEHGVSPAVLVDRLMPEVPLQGAHGVHLDDDDCTLLAVRGAGIAHCPASNMKLASGFCNLARLEAHGIAFGIGTDGCASNNRLDSFAEMRLAALLAKSVSEDPAFMDAHRTLHAATLGGAQVLGLDGETGSLEAGKSADFIAVDLSDIASAPLYDIAGQLIYACGRNQVDSVWIAGARKVRSGELVDIDLEDIRARAQSWQQRIGELLPG
ncbi:MAG: amidohydrolase family protein [Gammaproteobacteria bacterium AqS3]|nr:amidohydrolase family protein [Gammaproteobacteria bacterium AqS3]